MKLKHFLLGAALFCTANVQFPDFSLQLSTASAGNVITVNAKKLGAPIQSTQWGIFFEDINYAASSGTLRPPRQAYDD